MSVRNFLSFSIKCRYIVVARYCLANLEGSGRPGCYSHVKRTLDLHKFRNSFIYGMRTGKIEYRKSGKNRIQNCGGGGNGFWKSGKNGIWEREEIGEGKL